MKLPFPIGPNEEERLHVLHRLKVLNGHLPAGLDRICSVAEDLFRVPAVFIVFLDEDRAWVKDRQQPAFWQAPREISFCNYTILHDEVFVVPDARADTRFAEHPLVSADPSLLFYAGAPITVELGVRIGSLCIIDYNPRDFTPREMGWLSSLARLVVDELWLFHLEQTGMAGSVDGIPALPPNVAHADFAVAPAVTGAQIRAGRGMVKWSVRELAEAAGIAPMTVKRLEAQEDALNLRSQSARAVQEALEGAGVEFIFQPGARPGVRPR
ncbi:GAF domain-containing protein [Microvirga rosea]|uniref:GAF domain-containing protein n=1 Tax=Microvirga rosea TaxID=2715425 RepID=UPI001D09F3AC|nr:GAF domain-containing protein [Microvirga rosea]MCB8822228.1 GAF domain-containing protein [Microvirga rosea]